jgi:hypothetical protein
MLMQVCLQDDEIEKLKMLMEKGKVLNYLASWASIYSFHHQVQPLVLSVQLLGIAYLRNSPIVYSYRHSITFLNRSGI